MSDSEIQARVAATRKELENTLDAIEDKLNVPKQVGKLTKKAEASFDKNPVPWLAGGAAVAVGIVSLVAWALSSDD
ncbi:DUF3618 domain-containing protein [Glaciihabitans sp. dw_435]|uniref:DUF3618 domain-containing protein n=1 Tax=Glaciihabitans sp. dw_435 TaxID=2720081 RepID=UPI001BD2E133|nr:DUF3618 domain-containing protein [Glaciihabitans sp. dw_435]